MLTYSPGATVFVTEFTAESATPKIETPLGVERGSRSAKPVVIGELNPTPSGGPITVRLPSGFNTRSWPATPFGNSSENSTLDPSGASSAIKVPPRIREFGCNTKPDRAGAASVIQISPRLSSLNFGG